MKKPPPCVLTIAGSDSGGGAGVQADARTIHALGGYACTAITAITAQNGRSVSAWRAVSPGLLAAQIAAVLDDFPIAAIKTGLLSGPGAVRVVIRALKKHPRIPLVIDPVISSTSGSRFLSAAGVRVLTGELFSRAALITPNWPEASLLARQPVRDWADVEAVARSLMAAHGCAVLLKGGHAPGGVCRDCLVTPDDRIRWFESARLSTRNTHGTGCVLSAAIATWLARGERLPDAVEHARAFLQEVLRFGRRRRWGQGAGPAFAGR